MFAINADWTGDAKDWDIGKIGLCLRVSVFYKSKLVWNEW
jgi:hypothetical protein